MHCSQHNHSATFASFVSWSLSRLYFSIPALNECSICISPGKTQTQFEPAVAKFYGLLTQGLTGRKARPLVVCTSVSQCLPCTYVLYAGVPLFGLSRSAVPILHMANWSIYFKLVNFLWANFQRPAGMVSMSEILTWCHSVGLLCDYTSRL